MTFLKCRESLSSFEQSLLSSKLIKFAHILLEAVCVKKGKSAIFGWQKIRRKTVSAVNALGKLENVEMTHVAQSTGSNAALGTDHCLAYTCVELLRADRTVLLVIV